MMNDEFNTLVELLNSEPGEQCVVRSTFLDDLLIDPNVLASAAGRPVRSALEFTELPERNITLRDKVFVFGPKEAV